jgi:mannosyltransferase
MKVHPYLLLAGIIVIGSVLRIYQFGFQAVSCDELYSLMVAQRTYLDAIVFISTNETNPPLFYLLAHTTYLLSGGIDYAIRVPSVLFGILTIPAMYLLGKEWDEYTGLFCAGITAILYSLVYYSQFARAYSTATFFLVLFFWLFVRVYMSKHTNPVDYYLVGIIAGIALWIHLFVIFPIVVTLIFFYLTRSKTDVYKTLIPVILALLLLIPQFISLYFARQLQHFPGISSVDLVSMIPIEFFNIGIFIVVPLFILGIWLIQNDDVSVNLLVIAIVSMVLGMVAAQFTQVFPRYFLPVLPIFILFIGLTVSKLLMTMKAKYRPIIGMGFFLLLALTQANALLAHYTIPWLTC